MVSKNPEDTLGESANMTDPINMGMAVDDSTAARNIVDMFSATPDLYEFLTSPYDESPFDRSLETPQQTEMDDFLTSPAVADLLPNSDQFQDEYPLFGDAIDIQKLTMTMHQPTTSSTNDFSLDGLIPFTPALDPHDLMTSPALLDSSAYSPAPSKPSKSSRRKQPTGTRKNVTPETLVPIDAPTQTRTYAVPSATSRKELPAVFARKRARSTAFGDEEDELPEEGVQVTETEAEAIAAKRRQNTLAARRSRRRKLEYQQQLEDMLDQEKREKEVWRERALLCQAQLQSLGVNVPFSPQEL